MELTASDLSARLLATENLTVIRAPVESACFDIASRVLTLPMWKDMTPEIEDMLIGHEVGHALYTDERYLEPIAQNPKLQGYLNIIEDVRIEKLIKRKYPGLRKRMNEGYKQLNERDFFGVQKTPLESLLLIDKINLYFKAGYQCGVKFDADEKEYVNRAERTESVEEVIALAEDIYKFAKEKAEEEQQRQKRQAQQQSNKKPEEDEEEEPEDTDDGFYLPPEEDESPFGEDPEEKPQGQDESPQEEATEGAKTTNGTGVTEEPEVEVEPDVSSQTEKAFAEKLSDLADQSTRYVYHKILSDNPIDHVIGFKRVLQETPGANEEEIGDYYLRSVYGPDIQAGRIEYERKHAEAVAKFKADSTSAVNYLVKEFEMRKSASAMKRAQVSKTGQLDMRKVYAYKLQDDLFKRVTSIPNGKNHGMIFLIDWSGSMSDVIMDTLKQVINLCMFCNKAQIPYRVLAFTSQYPLDGDDQRKLHDFHMSSKTHSESYLVTWAGFHMLELFSSRMTMSEFNLMTKRVLDPRFFWNKGYDLGGTPLNEGLAWVYNHLGEYIKANRIEKMNFITLSDGAGHGLQSTHRMMENEYSNGKHVKVKNLIREETSKKTYEISRNSQLQAEVLLRMIKDRYNVNVVGFYICHNRRSHLGSAVNDNIYGFRGNMDGMVESMRKAFKEDGFYSMAGTGRDDLFIVPATSTKIDDSDLVASSEMSAKALARNLGKFLNTKKTSRVLLGRFIEYVA